MLRLREIIRDMRISRKLTLAFGLLILLAVSISIISYFALESIIHANALTTEIQEIADNIIQLDLSEKNFILYDARDSRNDSYFKTGKSDYLTAHQSNYIKTIYNLDSLIKEPTLLKLGLSPKLQDIKNRLLQYQIYFEQFVALTTKAGFKDWGLEGNLRDAIHSLENSTIHYDKADMLLLRRNEKDYFLRKDLQYQQELHKHATVFESNIMQDNTISPGDKQKLISLLRTYVMTFDQEVELHKIIGLTQDEGVISKMRTTFHSIDPEVSLIIKKISQYENSTIQRTISLLTILILSTLAIGAFLTKIMTNIIAKPIKKLTNAAEKFAQGQIDINFDISSHDEIGQLAQTFRDLIKATRDMADVAAKIGTGTFSGEIKLRSNMDVLGQSLIKMRDNLKILQDENQQQLWIKSELAKITNISQGIRNLQTLAQTIISELCKTLGAGYGLFYLASHFHKENTENELVLLGSYAYVERKKVSNRFKLGEGLVGQSALEKTPILLTQVPADYLRISSGLGEQTPLNILVTPILYEDQVVGVIELASFKILTPNEQDLLMSLSKNLGIIINNINSHQKTENLLNEAQTLTEELQTQQEELRTTNEELEEKTRILKMSEEKLKVQSEELQATNEELEEKTECLTQQNLSIEEQNKAIEKARSELEQRAKDLAMASKYKSEFLANMSHELRTPLNSLLILSKNLQENREKNLTDKQVEAARVIYSGGKELLNLINDILDLSKVEAGRLQLALDQISVKNICDGIKAQFEPLAREKNIAFHIAISPKVPDIIISDEQRLLQIIKNLLSNAFKFTKEGHVTLKVGCPEGQVSVKNKLLSNDKVITWSVIDTGIGIPKDKQVAIFEAFQQADGSTSRNYGGTGLGLTISRALAELLGGEIRLESEVNKGSNFTLYLPTESIHISQPNSQNQVSQPQIEEQEFALQPATVESKSQETRQFIPDDRQKLPSKEKLLLLIEDDIKFANILMEIAKQKGYLCLAAGDGRSGFDLAKTYQPNAILLDLGLPDMDGSDLLAQLKFDLKTRHIPVHVISARDETPDIRQKGAIGYLTKPADTDALASVFNKIESLTNNEIRHVLVVEDDPRGQQAILSLIETPHIKIECVPTAKEAKELILKNAYDCIILDLNLPDKSGFDLMQSMNKEKIDLPPIVIYTGRELTEDEHNALQKYASSIIIKGADSPERLVDEVSLFLHSVESDLPEKQKMLIQHLHNPDKILNNKKVLLVDDDMRNVFALSSVLEEKGIDVLIAANGKLALDKLSEEKDINMILMDIMMPVMNGYEAMKKIRENRKYKDLPIVALTAKAMPEDREKCMNAGANDYITKPIDIDQLFSMMEVWLSK